MATKVFINLPVGDLERSKKFYQHLGYTFDERFTDNKAACLVISEDIYAMLVTYEFFKTFTSKPVADASKTTETLVALSADSREEVDSLYQKALEAGGTPAREPEDYGWMYGQSFHDPDGHIWEVFYMDTANAPMMQETATHTY